MQTHIPSVPTHLKVAFCKKNTGIAVEPHGDGQIMDELSATQTSLCQVLIFHANKLHTLYLQGIHK